MRIFFILLLVFSSSLGFSQEENAGDDPKPKKERIPEYRMNIKGEFKLPTPIFNKAFARTTNGIADAAVSFNYPIIKNFHLGLGMRYSYFQVNDLKINNNTNANLQIYTPYVRCGFEKFGNARFLYGMNCNVGYAFNNFFSSTFDAMDSLKCTPKQSALMLEPAFSLSLIASENLAFSFTLGYTFIFETYTASNVCLPAFSGLAKSDSQGIYQFISAGFGFTAFLGGEKRKGGGGYKGYGI